MNAEEIIQKFILWPFKRQTHKNVKYTQTICRLLPTNCLSVLDHFTRLALKELIKFLFTVGVSGLKLKTKKKNLIVEFVLPPSKYFPSTNAWTPSSSTPTPTNPIPWASNCGLILLKSNAQARHNCHPHRRRKANTIVFELHSEFKGTNYNKTWRETMQTTCNFQQNIFEYISDQNL